MREYANAYHWGVQREFCLWFEQQSPHIVASVCGFLSSGGTKPENPGTTEESGTSIETTTGTLSNGKAITKENVLELLREIENEYPIEVY